jgi:hypothetical protein
MDSKVQASFVACEFERVSRAPQLECSPKSNWKINRKDSASKQA